MAALLFCAFRAKALGATMVVLRCARLSARFGWIGLDRDITQDALDAARLKVMKHVDLLVEKTGARPELVISAEEPEDAIRELVDKDRAIQMLVLASAVGRWGPGPLVSRLARGRPMAGRPLAVVVVPGDATEAQLAELSALTV